MAKFSAITHRPDDDDYWGKHVRQVYEVTGDTDYPTGGYPVNAADFGGGNIRTVRVVGRNAAAARLLAEWDHVNGKLLVMYPTGGATASPSSLSDPIVTSGAATASAVDETTPNITPGRGKEVADDTDLSTCKWLLEILSV